MALNGEIALLAQRAWQALERWDVATARREAEQMRLSAAGWGDAMGVAWAEILLARTTLLTCAAPDELSVPELEPSPTFAPTRDFLAARARLEIEIRVASQKHREFPKLLAVGPEDPADDLAVTTLVALRRLQTGSRIPQRLVLGVWPDDHPGAGWQRLAAAVEAEAEGKSGIELVERAIVAARSAGQLGVLSAALGARASFCERRGASDAALATRRQKRELLERWALGLPPSDAAGALLRADCVGVEQPQFGAAGPELASQALLEAILGLARERDGDRLVELALKAAVFVTDAERGLLLLSDGGGGQRVVARHRVDAITAEELLGLSSTIAQRALVEGEVVICDDVRSDPRFRDNKSLPLEVTGVLCAPIHARGELEGAIYLDRRQRGRPFGSGAVAAARTLGSMLAAALLNTRTISALEARTAELETLRDELDRALATRTHERDEIGRRLARRDDVTLAGRDVIVGSSPVMLRLRRVLQTVAVSEAPVLIVGETGSGKELVARAIHAASARRDQPFVAINCAALSETLLAAELFGSARGAFTGATAARPGLFVAADRGTLFLDEVGDMPPAMQRALLRALETCEILPVGATEARKVDVRVVAATHRDLAELAAQGTFRDDLRYRLDVARVEVPPLRARLEDLPELCACLLADVQQRYNLPQRRLSAEALAAMTLRRWPGNVRELRHLLASAALNATGPSISPVDLPPDRTLPQLTAEEHSAELKDVDGHALRAQSIRRALRASAGHRGRAAQLLGIARSTLYRYCETYSIDTKEYGQPGSETGSTGDSTPAEDGCQ